MAAFTASSSSSSSSLSLSLVPKSAAFLEPRNHQKKERMLLDKRTMKAVQLSFRLSLSWRRLTSSLASLLVFFLFFLLLHRLSSSSSLVGSGASEKEKSGGSSCVGRSLGVKTSSVVPAASDPMELPAQGGAQTPSFFPAFSYPSLIGVRAEEGSFSGGHDARGTAELRQQRKKPWIGSRSFSTYINIQERWLFSSILSASLLSPACTYVLYMSRVYTHVHLYTSICNHVENRSAFRSCGHSYRGQCLPDDVRLSTCLKVYRCV